MKTNRIISTVSSVLVLGLAVGAFVISYDALRALAISTGAVSPSLAWIFPLLVDGALVIFSLSVLRASLNRERVLWPMALVGLFTIASVAGNVLHIGDAIVPPDVLARIVAGVAPVALFLAFETLVGQTQADITRRGVAQSVHEMEQAAERARADVHDLEQQADQLDQKIQDAQAELAQMRREKRQEKRQEKRNSPANATAGAFQAGDLDALDRANETRQAGIDERRAVLIDLVRETPGASLSHLADRLSVSRSTVSRDVSELETAGAIRRNGHGIEVVS